MSEPIKNVEDLSKQNKIKYGLVRGGATESFFKVERFFVEILISQLLTIFYSKFLKGIQLICLSKDVEFYAFSLR